MQLTNIYRNLSFANRTTRTIFFSGHQHFHAIHTQVIIDNAGYICYAEARFLGHQNDAKQFTMMQQIGVNGPLHFLKDCILLADQIYPNRHPTVTLFTSQQINGKPEHMRDRSILSDYWAGALAYWAHTFFLYTLAGQVDFLRFFFLISHELDTYIFSHKQLVFFFFALFNSSVDWALSLFYKFNCWANRYFEEVKKMNRPINLINIEQSLKKSVQKMQQTCFRFLVEHMIGD